MYSNRSAHAAHAVLLALLVVALPGCRLQPEGAPPVTPTAPAAAADPEQDPAPAEEVIDTRQVAARALGVPPESLTLERRLDYGHTIADSYHDAENVFPSCLVNSRTGEVMLLTLRPGPLVQPDRPQIAAAEALAAAWDYLDRHGYPRPQDAVFSSRIPDTLGTKYEFYWQEKRAGVLLPTTTSMTVDAFEGEVIRYFRFSAPVEVSLTPTLTAEQAIAAARAWAEPQQDPAYPLDRETPPEVRLQVARLPLFPPNYRPAKDPPSDPQVPVETASLHSPQHLAYLVQLTFPRGSGLYRWGEPPAIWVYVDAHTGEVLDHREIPGLPPRNQSD